MKVLKGENKEQDKDLYKVLKSLPAASARFKLNSTQKYWYTFYGGELIKTNKFTKVDIIHLVKLAVAVSIYQAAVKHMNSKPYLGGIVQVFGTGAQQISPHLVAQRSALGQISEVSKHFGFSFLDRYNLNKVPAAGDPDQGDLFTGFNKQKVTG